MLDGLGVVIVLFLVAGGGVVVIDALIIRKLRRGDRSTKDEP